jgi:mannose PTS system EIIA component
MKGIVLASHGEMANGLLDTSKLFFGDQEQLTTACIYAGQDPGEYVDILRDKINEVDTGEGTIVLCDVLFGTPCNSLGRLIGEGMTNFEVITGMNLPILLQLLAIRENGDVDIADLVNQGVEGIKDFKAILNSALR